MTGYADPETLVGEWLRDHLDVKVWINPKPPGNAWTTAAWAWVQRSPGGDTLALSLDDALLDISAVAAEPDHARNLGNQIWSAMTLTLPLHTFDNGVFVKSVTCAPRPFWAPDPQAKRLATYRVILHGLI